MSIIASEDNRADKYPIAVKSVDVHIDVSASTTVGETDVMINGEVLALVYDVPDLDGTTPTITFKVENKDDTEIHSKASIAENGKTLEKLLPDTSPQRFPVAGLTTFQVTASEAQSTDKTVTVVVYYR